MEISLKDLKNLQANGAVFILDVRENWELLQKSIEGVIHIPLGQLPQQYEVLPHGVPIYVLCKSGHRSWHATLFLRKKGFEAYNLQGGIENFFLNSFY